MGQVRLGVLLGASLLGLNAPALAQTEGSQDVVPGGEPEEAVEATSAETIVVEARRRDESVQDVPLVVNAVTAEKINELNLRDFKDIQTVVPGLTMANNANGIGTTSSVRGVNFDVNASGSFGTIEYYLNDAPITSGAIFSALFDIGQIEVLRGPQGTLRGKASPSGSITIAHRKPDLDEVGGYAMGTLNDIGGANVNAAVGLPIIPGKLAVRVAGLVERGRGNRVRSINNPTVSPFTRTKAGRVILRAEPVDWFNAEGEYQRIESRSRQFDQAACFNLFSATAPACPVLIEPGARRGIQAAARETSQTFDIFTWKASARFAGQRLHYVGLHVDQLLNSFAPGDPANVVNGVFCVTCTTNDSKFDTHEVRLQNEERVFGLFDYVVGYFHFKQDTPSFLVTGRVASGTAAAPVFAFSPTLRGPANVKEESYFGNLTLHLGERTELSGGARHIKVDSDSRLSSVTLPAGVVAPRLFSAIDLRPLITTGTTITELNLLAPNPREFRKTIYSASAKHRFNDDLMVYANFGTSFRPGNNVVRFPANQRTTAFEGNFLFLPSETSKSYEIGFKSEWLDDTLTINVSAYRQNFKNYPLRSPSGVLYLQYDTPGDPNVVTGARVASFSFVSPVPVRVNGVEAEFEWRPSDRFDISGNIAYALGKVRNGLVACSDLNGDGVPDVVTTQPSAAALFAVVGGNHLATCPVNFRSATAAPWNATLQAEYSLPFGDASEGFLRGLLTYRGNSQNDPANAFDDYDGFGLLNLYAGLRDPDGAWEITAYGKNITGNDTVLSTSNGALFTAVGTTTVTAPYIGLGNESVPGLVQPREFGVTARFAFGSR